MKAMVVAMAAVLAGCAGMDPLPRPAEGFEAVRVRERLTLPTGLGSILLAPGATLVADQSRGGRPVYCGPGSFRDIVTQPMEVCLTYDGESFEHPTALTGRRWPVPPGAIERIRLR